MFKFLKKLFGSNHAGTWAPTVTEPNELLTPQHNVNPKPKGKKPSAPKAPPKPLAKKTKVEPKVEKEAPKKRGRKPKAK